MTQLYLVRHGQAVVNVQPIVGGMRGDRGLTTLGIQQAQCLRDRLTVSGEIQPDVIIASTMPRALQTAQIVREAFQCQFIEDDQVQELNPGEADGMTFEEFAAKYGKFRFDPSRPLSPGGETWPQFKTRVVAALERICTTYADQSIMVVCHGWVIEAAFIHFLGLQHVEGPQLGFQTENTSISHWQRYVPRHETHPRWRMIRYNDAIHLHAAVRWEAQHAEGIDHPAVPIAPPA